jgi:hypothetical protein
MSARDDILSAIRRAGVPASLAAAAFDEPRVSPDALRDAFLRVLTDVGGIGVIRRADQSVEQVVATQPGTALGRLLVVRGRFAVAENGAVYVDAADIDGRNGLVLAETLVVVVPFDAIVATMHEAMRLIPRDSACGWFLSGPSKTADIEQSLVFGAQGSRTHCVVFDVA